eukprot:Seg1566.12 transcript_id=Seg1566.12/GoldUCD/mRNA.D3Y31 product="Pleckstrin-like domain-containing family A member 8" protein_id=Seg1566.12/GoldUCD/D3Y31
MTFFATVRQPFLEVPSDSRIITRTFLDACNCIVPFFDILGSTAFAPVKSDINGNISKLQKKYESDREKFAVLQSFVEVEMAEGSTKAKNSATDALLWLKRALEFIGVFLAEVLTGQPDLSKCAKKAYESTLKKYHGWIVQGIFSLAMKAVPYRENFIAAIGNGASEEDVLKDMQVHVNLMGKNIEVINDFYAKVGQDKQEKV